MIDNSMYLKLTLNNSIYYNRCFTTDVITRCTLIVPCLIPVYVLYVKYRCGTSRKIRSTPCHCTNRYTVSSTLDLIQIFCLL